MLVPLDFVNVSVISYRAGHALAQLVEALCSKFAGSIPDGDNWDFSLT